VVRVDEVSKKKISERIQQCPMSAETEKNDNSLPFLPNDGGEGLLVRVSEVEKKRSDNYQKNPYSYE
jgi:hypothetical protein